MLREELFSGPVGADNIQRGCSTISMVVSVHTWLEMSAQGKVHSKRCLDLREEDMAMLCIGGLLLMSTASQHRQVLPTCLWLPSPPAVAQSSSLSPVLPARLRRKQPCSKAKDNAELSASTAGVRVRPAGRQGII